MVTGDLIARARARDGDAFRQLTEPHGREARYEQREAISLARLDGDHCQVWGGVVTVAAGRGKKIATTAIAASC